MAFCGSCGLAVNDSDQFCARCGAPVDTAPPPQAPVWPLPSGPTQTLPLAGRRPSRRLVSGLVSLVVVVVAAVVAIILGSHSSPHQRLQAATATTTQPAAVTMTEPSNATTTQRPGSSSKFSDVTASQPARLLGALDTAVGPAYPPDELSFTYSSDPNDSTWLFWRVQGASGYQSQVQPAGGFAHLAGSSWKIWGPGTNQVGCSAHGSQGAVPSSVISALGQSCGPNSDTASGSTSGYGSYTNTRFGFSTDYPTVLVAEPPAQDGSGTSWKSSDGTVLFLVSGENNSMGWSSQQDEVAMAKTIQVTYHKIVGDIMTLNGTRNNGQTYVYERDVVGSGSIDSMHWEFPANQISTWGPILSQVIQSFRPGDITGSY